MEDTNISKCLDNDCFRVACGTTDSNELFERNIRFTTTKEERELIRECIEKARVLK